MFQGKLRLNQLAISAVILFYFSVFLYAQSIFFNDSDPDHMIIENSEYYKIVFLKKNGAIAHIIDKTTGKMVSVGSQNQCLWFARFYGDWPNEIGGCHYVHTPLYKPEFRYSWNSYDSELTMDYIPDNRMTHRATVKVKIKPTVNSWFDMTIEVTNNWGNYLDYVDIPANLLFMKSQIKEILYPYMPGVLFNQEFFNKNNAYVIKYPGGAGAFADYISLKSSTGQMAIYPVYDYGHIYCSELGFRNDADSDGTRVYYKHSFACKTPNGEQWTSPTVRVYVGEAHPDTIRYFARDSGLDGQLSIQDKLGNIYEKVAESVFYKLNAEYLEAPFSAYKQYLEKVPYPGILHPVAFQENGFDENYPDFLPPDPRWGTTEDFVQMFKDAKALGFLVAPYINPTWWDDESPTIRSLPADLTINDIAAIDENGSPYYETYGNQGGYVVSPYPQFVDQRLDNLLEQFKNEVPSDLIFEDQVGARPWLFDFNQSAPGPMYYPNGWIKHTGEHREKLLMTEFGYDRLTDNLVAFHGSYLLNNSGSEIMQFWGTGTWEPYPMAAFILKDKVLFYHHNLDNSGMAASKYILTWNAAMGYMSSFEISPSVGNDEDWLKVVGLFQKYIFSKYASEKAIGFKRIGDGVVKIEFESMDVIANWDPYKTFEIDGYAIPKEGFLIESNDGNLKAGILRGLNNQLFSRDEYILIQRNERSIIVRKPYGAAGTDLKIIIPEDWKPYERIYVVAVAKDGDVLSMVPRDVYDDALVFNYEYRVNNVKVDYYKISVRKSGPDDQDE